MGWRRTKRQRKSLRSFTLSPEELKEDSGVVGWKYPIRQDVHHTGNGKPEALDVPEENITEFLDEVPPAGGHSQRGHAILTVESDGDLEVDQNDVIDVARGVIYRDPRPY